MYPKLDLSTYDEFTQTRVRHMETQFEEGVDHTFTSPAIGAAGAGILTLDLALSRVFDVALDANITTWSITNVPANRLVIITLQFTGDGTPRTVSMPASFHLPSDVPYTPTSTNGQRDRISLETMNGGADWDFFVIAQNLDAL